jgi:hypothetical protein
MVTAAHGLIAVDRQTISVAWTPLIRELTIRARATSLAVTSHAGCQPPSVGGRLALTRSVAAPTKSAALGQLAQYVTETLGCDVAPGNDRDDGVFGGHEPGQDGGGRNRPGALSDHATVEGKISDRCA